MTNEYDNSTHELQQISQHCEPFGQIDRTGAETAHCSNCGADVEPVGKGRCPACGCFLIANSVAVTHGGRRLALAADRESRRSELRAAVLADLGGNVPPITGEVVEDFVSACILRDQLVGYLEAIGPLTQRGTRRAAMDLYLAMSARIESLSVLLSGFRNDVRTERSPSDSVTRIERVVVYPRLEALPTPLSQIAQDLLSREARGELLTERERGSLDVLESIMRGALVLPGEPPPVPMPGECR